MSNIDIIRAWKDEDYRNSLTEEQRSMLPENPAGLIELDDNEMESVCGGLMKNDKPVFSKYDTFFIGGLNTGTGTTAGLCNGCCAILTCIAAPRPEEHVKFGDFAPPTH